MADNDNKKIADLLFPHIDKTVEYYLKKYPSRNLKEGVEVTRVAPSPTGYMHIGGVFQALINSQISKHSGGIFYLRNEDTDSKREVLGAADIFIPALNGFGIYPDEGFISQTEEKGDYGPYIQSKRKEIYQTFAKELVSRGCAYPCFCEKEDEEAKKEQARLGVPTGYYGKWAKCRDLTYEQIKANIDAGKKFTIRIKANGDGKKRFIFEDLRIGKTSLPVNMNDYVVLKSDGQAVYHMAHLVDDTLMHTTTVVRDESWFPSVPLHIQMFEYMGFKAPKYLHTPTVNTIDKETGNSRKVSKRKDDWADSRFFHRVGYPKNAIVDYLMNLINSNYEVWREANPKAGVYEFPFSAENMSKSSALFDMAKIDNISKNVIAMMSGEELYVNLITWAKEYCPEIVSTLEKDKNYTISVLGMDKNEARPRKDITTYSEIKDFYSYMFADWYKNEYPFAEKLKKEDIQKAVLEYAKEYNHKDTKEEWFARMKKVATSCNFATDNKLYKQNPEQYAGNMADFAGIIRIVVTGRAQTPDLYSIMQILGEKEVLSRLNAKF